MRTELQISPKIIHWIAALEHKEPQMLANELAPKKVDRFLNGLISKTTATELANRANIPFGYLFLQTPPEIEKPSIPDLRQTVGAEPLSQDFFDVLKDIEHKQSWFKDFLIEQGNDPLAFVSKYPFHSHLSVQVVVNDILNTLGIQDIMQRIASISKNDYFKFLINEFERIGILIFKNGVVRNSTKRKLNVNEFRGFALVDRIVPVIFINGSDSVAAQIFTLLHEVAHIWIGQSGVSSWNQEQAVETFCNKVAAEFLMPSNIFMKYWQVQSKDRRIDDMATIFKVSRLAIIIKAVTLELLPPTAIHDEREHLKVMLQKESNGGNFYNTMQVRQSKTFSNTVINQAISQHLPLREAARLLNTNADVLMKAYRKLQGRE
ncbi:ImmA/IrrE family metallo-endopeptidase [Actinobacillus equuli]|uniref:ImmA/IrrE family metallo-endopeptidase n=1 Tax=Actinobacillus equuli TaxID=718 RepID=UPI002442AE5F|nr:ImmA/IrrE family metallo-endopeptidase [Actinobacillus equuli]WGE42524.1 ImmA/IrrE family metallo-endopeptidase [Actinobacillus equuli subsp. haemolyticus]